MSQYRFEIFERDGTPVGEVQDASTRFVERQLRRPATAGFTIRTTNPLLEAIHSGDMLLRVTHRLAPTGNEALAFHGPLISLETNSDADGGPSCSVTASDPAFFFTKRLVGRDADGTLYNIVDKIDIAEDLIDDANVDGETGVRTLGTVNSGTTAVYIAGPYKLLDECINELADTFDGFDWYITPIDYDDGKIGEFTAAAVLGEEKVNAAFEYGPGTRNNVRTFRYLRSWQDMGNRVYHLPEDLTTGSVIIGTDATSQTEHGLYHALVEASDLTNDTLRQELVDYHISIRKDPRNILEFSPVVDPDETSDAVPLYGFEYDLGDLVPVKIAPEGDTLIEGMVRIWKMRIEIDKDGRTLYTPTTVPE